MTIGIVGKIDKKVLLSSFDTNKRRQFQINFLKNTIKDLVNKGIGVSDNIFSEYSHITLGDKEDLLEFARNYKEISNLNLG